MRKILLITLMLINIVAYSQLNDDALMLKNSDDQVVNKIYTAIKTGAVDKWGTDNAMIVYVINKQSTDCLTFFKMECPDKLSVEYMGRWHENINGITVYDWSMILYSYKKWLKNSDY